MAQMRQKFRKVPHGVQNRITQASPTELDMWLMRVLTAKTPEAVVA